ncbi:hypothetical protein AB0M68_32530 [Streptomyces sp. NPDC051453]|uniref:hypothetical protein n=1 Tax=Streptomyces sp. NPDC051453 TaxID=3154941 RepID=UPI003439DCFB
MTPDAAWKLSPTLSLVTVQGQWIIEDPRRGSHRLLNTRPPWLLALLTMLAQRDEASWSELTASAVGQGVPPDRADACIRSLAKAHLIVPAGTHAPSRDASALRDHQWALASERMDYTDESAIADDIALMYRYAESSPPPAPCWEPETESDSIMLPHPMLDHGDRPLVDLGRLLYFTNAILGDTSIGPLPRSRRVPPSHGASHPFDLSLHTARPSAGGSTAHYGYDPSAHALVRLKAETATPMPVAPQSDVLSVHAALERVQWRYRTSTAYPTLFLDLGHLVETLFQVAETLGWDVLEIPHADEPVLDSRLPGLGPVFARFALSPSSEGVAQ